MIVFPPKSRSNFSHHENVALKVPGELNSPESVLMPLVVIIPVKHCLYTEGVKHVYLLETILECDFLNTYRRALIQPSLAEYIAKSFFSPLLPKLSLHHSDSGLIFLLVTVLHPVSLCYSR